VLASLIRLLVDEYTASATLITRLLAAGHEVVQLPRGTPDEVVFSEVQRLALPNRDEDTWGRVRLGT
jgi:hypothetical protein